MRRRKKRAKWKMKRNLNRRRSRLTITGALGILPLADPTQERQSGVFWHFLVLVSLANTIIWILVLPIQLSLVWFGINWVRTWLRLTDRLLLTLHRVWVEQIHYHLGVTPESGFWCQFKLMLVEFVMLLFIVPELVVVLLRLLVFFLVVAASFPDWWAGYRLITDVKEKATRFSG